MTNKNTRRAFLASLMALILCVSSLLGTTYAWFTDEVTSANNKIVAGNLDVELYYQVEGQSTWTKVTESTNIFKENALWEPGHTEVVKLKVVNEGTLALKYQLGVNVVADPSFKNAEGDTVKLSDFIKYGIVDGDKDYTRDTAIAEVDATATKLNEAYHSGTQQLLPEKDAIVTMVVYMPTTVGNEANYAKGEIAPEIKLGLSLYATQMASEGDSFGTDYDADAPAIKVADTAELQAVLDSAAAGTVIQLTPGVAYGAVAIRPTASNDTTMYCETHDFTTDNAEAFKAHLAESGYHTTPKYTTTFNDVTIIGAEGATVAGFVATSGHAYGDVYDYVRDIDYSVGSAYYNTLYVRGLTFKGVAFVGKININTSDAETVYNGVIFDSCSFTTGGTASDNGAAVRYYNEANNGNVKNIVVKNCSFKNCYQGVYVQNVNGVTVTDSIFDTTGHNALGIQGSEVNLKNVVITGNTFKNIGDRIIRFDKIAADSNITIQNNVATNSGDDADEVIKATSIAAGVTTSVKNNSWGKNKIVVNNELKDQDDGTSSITVSNSDALKIAVDNGKANIDVSAGTYTFPASSLSASQTLNCDPDTVFKGAKLNANGATVVGATFSGTASSNTVNGIYKDCSFTGSNGLRYGYVGETAVFENCEFSGDVYGIHFDGGANEVIFKNCTISGFNATAAAVTKVTFEGCTFVGNGKSAYNGINLWGNGDFKDCTFVFDGSSAYEWIDLCSGGKTANFENCVVNDGTTTSNVSTLIGDKLTKRSDTGKIIVDGVELTY